MKLSIKGNLIAYDLHHQ